MCGILGIISRRGRVDVARLIGDGVASLRHRGPDAQGQFVSEAGDWEIGLGHTRLSILDLSDAGSQPMLSADGRLQLIFNGEVYNYAELRRELVEGYSFRGHSDTETIVAGMQAHGFGFSKRLRGMYAYGVVDSERRVLQLARDPFGIKPLYYYATDDVFLFASEVRTILESGLPQRRLCREAVTAYLETGSTGEYESIVAGIRSLGAGQELAVSFSGDRLRVEPIDKGATWAKPVTTPKRRQDAVSELRELLKDSVRQHLVSDVPIGLFLSGGIDSSALLALMREVEANEIRSFTVAFRNSELSEESHARRIAAHYGAEHHEVVLSEEGLLARLPAALRGMDQPTADGVNSYIVSEGVRSAGLKVALSGLGGDEIFCGYPSFRRQVALARLGRAGQATGRAVSVMRRAFGLRDVRWEKMDDFLQTGGRPEEVYGISRRMFPPPDVAALLGVSTTDAEDTVPLPEDGTNAISHLEISRYMRNTLLRDCDVMSMAHSLEVRVPFVDVPLCRYVLSLPGEWKLNGGRQKPLLLDALGAKLPEYVWNRKKMGFTLPFAEWMLGRLRDEITETLNDKPLLEGCGLNPEVAMRIWTDFQANPGRWRWSRPWSLCVLARWCKQHGVTV